MENKSFSFYRSFYESVKDIEDPEIQLSIYNAIFEYGLNGKEIKLSGLAKTIFTLIKPLLEANHKRRENGAKGGNAKANSKQKDSKSVANDKQKCSKSVANDKQNDSKDLAYKDKDKDKDSDTNIRADAIINLYHECCPSLPKVSKLNDARKRLINARLKDYTVEELKAIFIKAEKSTFLKEGQGTWNGANFDWIMNATNICKIEDGYYTDKEEPKEEEKTFYGYMYCDTSVDERGYKECWDYDEWSKYNGWT